MSSTTPSAPKGTLPGIFSRGQRAWGMAQGGWKSETRKLGDGLWDTTGRLFDHHAVSSKNLPRSSLPKCRRYAARPAGVELILSPGRPVLNSPFLQLSGLPFPISQSPGLPLSCLRSPSISVLHSPFSVLRFEKELFIGSFD